MHTARCIAEASSGHDALLPQTIRCMEYWLSRSCLHDDDLPIAFLLRGCFGVLESYFFDFIKGLGCGILDK